MRHEKVLPYHPQSNGQAKISNIVIKNILEKIIKKNRKDWSSKLDDALWAYIIDFKTPIGMSSCLLIFRKPCHLSLELERHTL